MPLDALIEAVLFWRAEPLSIPDLSRALDQPATVVEEALKILDMKLSDRGLRLLRKDNEVMLGTALLASGLIEKLSREELERDLGRAGLETLTIILYRSPISRSDIDYIRGVNSSFILRHLLVRGLAERIPHPTFGRGFLYRPTFDLLQHLGLKRIEDLPDYGLLKEKIDQHDH